MHQHKIDKWANRSNESISGNNIDNQKWIGWLVIKWCEGIVAHFVEQIKLAHNTLYKVETFLNGLKIYQVNGEKM